MSNTPRKPVLQPCGYGDLGAGVPGWSSALRVYYCRYWAELRRHIELTFGKGPPEPEDVVQEAFARFAALSDPARVDNPRAFLYASARNVAIDERRKILARNRWAHKCAGEEAADDLDSENVLSSRQRLAIIEETIRSLEFDRRLVFVMNRIEGLSSAEISRRTGMAETTVKRHVALAVIACERALRAADGNSQGAGVRR